MVYNFLRPVVNVLLRIIYKIDIKGIENVPKEGGLILAGNHIHIWDPLVAAVEIKNREVHFMAKVNLFKNPFMNWLLTKAYAIPVRREEGDMKSIKAAMKVLKHGDILGLYPEGTRNQTDQEMLEPKGGLVLLATRMKVPVVPMGIKGEFKFRKPVKLRFGNPIYFDKYYDKKLTIDEYVNICKEEIYPEIIKLKEAE